MLNTSTTALEAVNTALSCIGEAPVNSLDTAATSDVALAVRTFNEVNRKVQSEGWDFNTEEDVELAKDDDGNVALPLNTLRAHVDKTKYAGIDPVVRGNSFYDRKNRTYAFTTNIVAQRLVLMLDFTELPQTAREYITIRAARLFVDRSNGDQAFRSYTLQEEMDARKTLIRDQSLKRDVNYVNSPVIRDVLIWRRNGTGI